MTDVNIELSYDSADQIPEGFKGLYDEVDGKFTLAGVNGIKTQKDVNNVQEALRKERNDHGEAKTLLGKYRALGEDPDAIQTQLDRIAELEAAAGGKLDDNKIQEMVEARLGQKTSPLERQIANLTNDVSEKDKTIATLQQALVSRDMNDAIRSVATEMKVLGTAIPDVEMVAAAYLEKDEHSGEFIVKADAKGVTPGLSFRS